MTAAHCKRCPGTTNIPENPSNLLEETGISVVEFSILAKTDRSTLIKSFVSVDDFMISLCEKLRYLKSHCHSWRSNRIFLSNIKENLLENEAFVMFDFSKNYTYVCQDAAQAFHNNNHQ